MQEFLKRFVIKIVLNFINLIFSIGQVVLWPVRYANKFSRKIKKRISGIRFKKVLFAVLKRWRKIFKSKLVVFALGVFFTFLFVIFPIKIYGWYRQLPQPELLLQTQNKPTKILDRKNRLLYEIYVDRKYEPVALDKIPSHVVNSTLAVEDSAFYKHNGIRLFSILRAVKSNVFNNGLQGGSTITQQLVKNVLLSSERTIPRKVKEIVLSLMVEKRFTKDQILEMYINNIPYGGTAWGIQAASQKYFGKNVWDLDLSEAAFLAGLPSAPSIYSPFIEDVGAQAWKSRQKYVLSRMVSLSFINKLDADEALAKPLVFNSESSFIRAPHFVWYVRDMLERAYGKRLVDFGGLTVKTTLDIDLQEKVQEIVANEVKSSAYLNISNGASVVLDVRTGGILAYVGSVDYFDNTKDGEFDVVSAYRLPGSAVKPITYALAFENGYTPASVLDDSPFSVQSGGQIYSPVNYDGKFRGRVTIRQALAGSYNIPAVRLLKSLGVDNMVVLGNKMGLKNWKVGDDYGLSITLGGKEVRLIDLSNVYATLARAGKFMELSPFLSVRDANGFEIFADRRDKETAVRPEAAYLITHILSDYEAKIPAFGVNNYLGIPGHTVAVKTGTTDEKRDNLTVGYTPSYVVGVWVGNNDNSPMNSYLASGLSGAAPIWNKIMKLLTEGTDDEKFQVPSNVIVRTYLECNGRSELFIKGTSPKSICEVRSNKSKNK